MDRIVDIPIPPAAADASEAACRALESGCVLHLESTGFDLLPAERRFLSETWASDGAKNISLRPGSGAARGAAGNAADLAALGAMLGRYADMAEALAGALLPRYPAGMKRGNTSFRPAEIESVPRTWRSDDRRLHVDSFPSNPVAGRRILRVFTNVHPGSEARQWRVGEPFAQFAARFFPRVKPQLPGTARVLEALGVTKARRTAYDHFMLGIHDAAKGDSEYQRTAPRIEKAFAPGATWIAFTDQVVHAAMRGQFAFEQTFYLEPRFLLDPDSSPLAVLERLAGRALVPR